MLRMVCCERSIGFREQADLEPTEAGQRIVDLVRVIDRRSDGEGYDGICW